MRLDEQKVIVGDQVLKIEL